MTTFFSDSTIADLAIPDALKSALGRAAAALCVPRGALCGYRHLLTFDDKQAEAGISPEAIREALREAGGR